MLIKFIDWSAAFVSICTQINQSIFFKNTVANKKQEEQINISIYKVYWVQFHQIEKRFPAARAARRKPTRLPPKLTCFGASILYFIWNSPPPFISLANKKKNVKENAQTKSVKSRKICLDLCFYPPAVQAACRMQQIVSIN